MPRKSSGDPPTTELVLPGETEVDPVMLDHAVQKINGVYIAKGLETAREIGDYVLEVFFGGDAKNFRRKGNHHLTFRALADRDDLHVSHVWIWRAVSVVDQLRLLPDDIGAALPYTHHTLLLPVRTTKTKVSLATRAARKHWSKRQLEAEIQRVRAKEEGDSRAGRPPLPRFVKTLRALGKLVESGDESFGDLDAVDMLDSDEAEALLKTVTAMRERCEALQETLQARVGGAA